MDILYNYQAYESAKRGLFLIETGEYKLPGGWERALEENSIIGETDDTYVVRLLQSGHGEWVGDTVVQRSYTLPIGINKTRFVKWVNVQLSLFE